MALAVVTATAPSLASRFFLDDYLHLERSKHLTMTNLLESGTLAFRDLQGFWWVPPKVQVRYFRPVMTLSIAMDRQIWGRRPLGYHLTNLFFHLLATWLVYRTGRQIVKSDRVALFAATLFGLHPVQVGAVQWISGRSDVIMTVFYLTALTTYLDLRLRPTSGVWRGALSTGAYALALLTKESAVSLPLVILAVERLVLRSSEPLSPFNPSARRTVGVIVLLAGILAGFRIPALMASTPPAPYWLPFSASAVPDLALQVLLYALASVFMVPVLPFCNLEAWKLQPWLVVAMGVLLLSVGIAAFRKSVKRRLLLFFLLWFVLTLLPVSFIMMGSRLAYLPTVGVCLLIGTALADRDPAPGLEGGGWRPGRILKPSLLLGCTLITLLQGSILQSLSLESDKMTRTLVRAAGRTPETRHLILVNAWAPGSLWINQAASCISNGERAPSITVATLSPDIFPPAFWKLHPLGHLLLDWLSRPLSSGVPPVVTAGDSGAVIVRARGSGLFESPSLRFFMFGRRGFARGEVVQTNDLTSEITRAEGSSVREIRFTSREPAAGLAGLVLCQEDLRITGPRSLPQATTR